MQKARHVSAGVGCVINALGEMNATDAHPAGPGLGAGLRTPVTDRKPRASTRRCPGEDAAASGRPVSRRNPTRVDDWCLTSLNSKPKVAAGRTGAGTRLGPPGTSCASAACLCWIGRETGRRQEWGRPGGLPRVTWSLPHTAACLVTLFLNTGLNIFFGGGSPILSLHYGPAKTCTILHHHPKHSRPGTERLCLRSSC